MNNLYVKGQRGEFYTPNVTLDAESGICEISGESYLEYTGEFYDQIIRWVQTYATEIKQTLQFDFKLTYFNTSSFKAILTLLKNLKLYENQGGQVIINWHYPDDDSDILKEAQDLAEGSGLEINFIAYKWDD